MFGIPLQLLAALIPADRNSHTELERQREVVERQREVVEAQIPERSRCPLPQLPPLRLSLIHI